MSLPDRFALVLEEFGAALFGELQKAFPFNWIDVDAKDKRNKQVRPRPDATRPRD